MFRGTDRVHVREVCLFSWMCFLSGGCGCGRSHCIVVIIGVWLPHAIAGGESSRAGLGKRSERRSQQDQCKRLLLQMYLR